MKPEEALEYFETIIASCWCGDTPGKLLEPYQIAAEAIEKRILMKIVEDGAFGCCPCCNYEFNSELISEYEIKYCLKCGQAIDWESAGKENEG